MTEDARALTLEPDRCSRHSVGIHASPAEVYHALTDPHELSRWFVSEASIDLRPGGSYRWVFGEGTGAAGPDALVTSGTFVAIGPQESLRLSHVVEGIETGLEFRFDPWRDGCIVTVSHSGFPGEESWDETFRSVDQGWQSEIQILKVYMEQARGMVCRSRFHQVRLPGLAEPIYDAFTTSAGLSSWIADRAAAEATLGGEFRLDRDGGPPIRGRFVVWDPDSFLVLTFGSERPSVVRLWLEADDASGSTDLSLEHRLFAPDLKSVVPFDWPAALNRLAAALKGPAS
jgi:uncharacterized protein YndB with AHSA1/START domain